MTDLNKYLQPLGSPVTQEKPIPAMQTETDFEIQARRIKSSEIIVKDLTRFSGSASGTISSTSNSINVFTINLAPKVGYKTTRSLANCFIRAYEGTTADANYQLYPSLGGSIGISDYTCWGGEYYDPSDLYTTTYKICINNISAGAVNLKLDAFWKYIYDNLGGGTI